MPLRLAIVVSHPIQHFAPWYREIYSNGNAEIKVFYCCDWGINDYCDPEFDHQFSWDIPLLQGYPYEFLPIKKRPKKLSLWQVDNPSIGDRLNEFKPDIILLHGYAQFTCLRTAHWAKKFSIPVLFFSDSTKALLPTFKSRFRDPMVRLFYHWIDGAFCIGDQNRSYHHLMGLPEERLYQGNYPVDCLALKSLPNDRDQQAKNLRQKWKIPKDAYVFLFCGKWIPRKCPLTLIQALHHLRDKPYWVIFVGEGILKQQMGELIRKQNLTQCILAGFVNQSKIATYYQLANALVCPSQFDNHPLVITEASAFGLPSIVSDRIGCIGPNDSARPNENALVFECKNPKSLAHQMDRLASNPILNTRLSIAAFQITQSQTAEQAANSLQLALKHLHIMGKRDFKGIGKRLKKVLLDMQTLQ